MATIRISLDKRTSNLQGQHPVRLNFNSNSKSASYSFNIFVFDRDWDKLNFNVLPTDKKYKLKNKIIEDVYTEAEKLINELSERGRLYEDAIKLRDAFSNKSKRMVDFLTYMKDFAEKKTDRTKEIYIDTTKKIEKHYKKTLYFDDINLAWLNDFDKKMISDGNKINSRSIHLRNIRAIFNNAIDNELISADLYPFRKFKIKKEVTAKRALTLKQIQKVIEFKGTDQENWARDVFMLSFFLIGINMKDLYYLNNTENKYLNYNRAKTNRFYNIKIEPETQLLLEKYKGENHLLRFQEQFTKYKSLGIKLNEYLKSIALKENIKPFTSYSARHSWATFASELEIPKETISAALGHGGNTVTDIYINFNQKKIDAANRKVISYVFKKYRRIRGFKWSKK